MVHTVEYTMYHILYIIKTHTVEYTIYHTNAYCRIYYIPCIIIIIIIQDWK